MSELPLWGLKEEVTRKKKAKGDVRLGVGVGVGVGEAPWVTPYIGYTGMCCPNRVSFFFTLTLDQGRNLKEYPRRGGGREGV